VKIGYQAAILLLRAGARVIVTTRFPRDAARRYAGERDGSIRRKSGRLVASFPVEEDDQIMLVTNAGQLIRTRVAGIRIVGRSTQGVIVFDTAEEERVVSVERISEDGES